VTVTGTGISQTSFDPLTADTTLTISPHITEGGYLRLETEVKIAKFLSSGTSGNTPPNKTDRQIQTSFLMPSSRTAVIGGIMTSDKTESETGVPVLKDIPLFGFLFRRTRDVDVRRTLYIFITPYILYDESFGDLREMTQEHLDDLIFAGNDKARDFMSGLKATGPPGPKSRSTFQFPRRKQE
jgi:type II secretory pathway component GspD/PulD (secretin)